MSEALKVVCPHCDATNRVPTARATQQPKCGSCHQGLFAGHPITLSETSFDHHIANSDIPVVVDFWAPWCGPCRAMAPEFEKAAVLLEPDFRLAKVNTEEARDLAQRYSIRSIPTMAFFRGGKETARQSGAMGAGAIVSWVRGQR